MEFVSPGLSARTGFLLFGSRRNIVWQYFHITLSFLTALLISYPVYFLSDVGKTLHTYRQKLHVFSGEIDTPLNIPLCVSPDQSPARTR